MPRDLGCSSLLLRVIWLMAVRLAKRGVRVLSAGYIGMVIDCKLLRVSRSPKDVTVCKGITPDRSGDVSIVMGLHRCRGDSQRLALSLDGKCKVTVNVFLYRNEFIHSNASSYPCPVSTDIRNMFILLGACICCNLA